jgi:hypothetical protein
MYIFHAGKREFCGRLALFQWPYPDRSAGCPSPLRPGSRPDPLGCPRAIFVAAGALLAPLLLPMPPAAFSPLVPRYCGWCQGPLTGRSDKQVCSSACRAMIKRHRGGEGEPIDWPARLAAAEQTVQELQEQLTQQAQAQQAALVFERDYDFLIRLLGQGIGEVQQLRVLDSYLEFVDALLPNYQQHPGLGRGDWYPRRRLELLHELRAKMVAQQATLQQRQAQQEQRRLQQVAADKVTHRTQQHASE